MGVIRILLFFVDLVAVVAVVLVVVSDVEGYRSTEWGILRHHVQEPSLGFRARGAPSTSSLLAVAAQLFELVFPRRLVDKPYCEDNELNSEGNHQELGRFSC